MKQGKHVVTKENRNPVRKRPLVTLIALILLVTVAVGVTIAFLIEKTPAVVNSFASAGAPTPEVVEDFDGEVKENVKIALKEDGTGACFVRAAIVFSFQDDEGNTVAKIPAAGTDYTIELGSDWAWAPDGYYYYGGTVNPGGSTTNLINSCTTLNTQYKLVVDIVAQTIQANPATAAQTEWGYVPTAA